MSTKDDNVLSLNNPVSITIGTFTYKNVVSIAIKYRSIDGGESRIPRSVPSYNWPVGWTHKPKLIEIVALIDSANIERDMVQSSLWGSNGEDQTFSVLSIVDRHATNGRTRTITFQPSFGNVIASVESNRVQLDRQLTEVTIYTGENINIPAWPNTTNTPITTG